MVESDELAAAYRRHFPIIRAKCARMLRDPEEAADVAQETFTRLWQSGVADKEAAQVAAWIYRTSTRLAIDRMRHRAVARRADPQEGLAPDLAAAHEARAELERVVRRVPREELSVVLLHRVDGLSQPEIAIVTGRSERTVRRLLARFDGRRW